MIHPTDSALSVQPGVAQQPSVNATFRAKPKPKRLSAGRYVEAVLAGDRTLLGQVITLIESDLERDRALAEEVVQKCLPQAGRSLRVGVTGVPGAGKSTLIEELAGRVIESESKRVAVLAVDPSSEISKGSILGDKSRMPELAANARAFVRPSPSRGSLGGVTRRTREAIIVCEAAGHEVIFVETVGVGQSESAVRSMVDCFLLLMLAGAGDELQGIKRGIMEMADVLAITKVDGGNLERALVAQRNYANALHMMPPTPSGWMPPVLLCSALTGRGIDELWESVGSFASHMSTTGWLQRRRREQAVAWMSDAIRDALSERFGQDLNVRQMRPDLERRVVAGEITPHAAARQLLRAFDGEPTG